jgi:hypothetical protein
MCCVTGGRTCAIKSRIAIPAKSDGSSLVRRIRRELSRAGISVRSLDSATQDRLRVGGGDLR